MTVDPNANVVAWHFGAAGGRMDFTQRPPAATIPNPNANVVTWHFGSAGGRWDFSSQAAQRGGGSSTTAPPVESIVRPFSTPPTLRTDLGVLNPPDLSTTKLPEIWWGRTAAYDVASSSSSSSQYPAAAGMGGGISVKFKKNKAEKPPKEKKKEDGEKSEIVFQEYSRATEKIKVENPQESDDWVEIERIRSITFSCSNDSKNNYKFVLNWDSGTDTSVGSDGYQGGGSEVQTEEQIIQDQYKGQEPPDIIEAGGSGGEEES